MKGKFLVAILSIICFLLILFLLFFCSQKVKAAENQFHDVAINELMWNGSDKSTADEWVELYNNTENVVDLSGWYFTYQNNSGELIVPELNIQGIIKPNSYFLISNYGLEENTVLDKTKILSDEVFSNKNLSLSNSFGYYQLFNSFGVLIDEVGIINKVPFNKIDQIDKICSMERNSPLLDGTISDNWHSSTLQNNILSTISYATPGAENSTIISPPPPENYFGKVIFTKIMPNPIDGNEWAEIKNISDKNIDLTNWKIKDLVGNSKTIEITINPNEVLRVSGFSFINNSGYESLFLFDSNQNLINQIFWNYNAPKGIEYFLDIDGIWKWNLPPIINYFGKIIFTEVLANPEGKDYKKEYVKIKNISNKTINLLGWKIKDKNSTCKILLGNIKSNQVVKISELSCINNKEERLFIYDNNQNLVSYISYNHKTVEDELYIFKNGRWFWQKPVFNLNQKIKEHKKYQIKDIRNLSLETKVLVEGTVTVKTGNFAKYAFYVQDNSGGIKIYCRDKPNVEVNDIFLIFGIVGKLYNQKVIKVKAIDLIKIGRKDHYVKVSDISKIQENQNQLVKIRGKVIKEKSKYFLSDDFGKIRIFFSSNEKIKKPKDLKYAVVEIIGIIDFYKDDFRLMPRTLEDIKILKITKPIKSRKIKLKSVVNEILGVQTVYARDGTNVVLGKDYRNNLSPIFKLKNTENKLRSLAIGLIFASFFGIILIIVSSQYGVKKQ